MLVIVVAGERSRGGQKVQSSGPGGCNLNFKFQLMTRVCMHDCLWVCSSGLVLNFLFFFIEERGEPAGSDRALCSHVCVVCEQRPH